MTEAEWLACEEPDLMPEAVEGQVSRDQLVAFVQRSWARVATRLPAGSSDLTAAEQYAGGVGRQGDHDAILEAAEAAGWAADVREEQRQQAALLRDIVDRQF